MKRTLVLVITKPIISTFLLFFAFWSNAQTKFEQFGKRRKDSLKSEVYEIYSARLKDGQVQKKSRRSTFYDGYPYRISHYKKVYLQNGLLSKRDNNNQVEKFYYNDLGQPLKRVIRKINKDDSIVVIYSYDDHNNITVIRSFGSKDIFYQWGNGVIGGPHGKYYTNFYLDQTDSIKKRSFDSIILVPENINRLYNTENKLIKEKTLWTRSEKYTYTKRNASVDSTILVSTYSHDSTNQLRQIVEEKIRKNYVYPNIYSKNPIITRRKEISYYNENGEMDSLIELYNGKLQRKISYAYDHSGSLTKTVYEDATLHSVKTETFKNGAPIRYHAQFKSGREFLVELKYEIDNHGNWIKCIHYINGKPKYWVERKLEYY